MKKQKGFTLIELLAVILILGIIALIAIPTVTKIIDESKKGAFESSVDNIVDVIEDTCQKQILNGDTLTTLYTFSDGEVSPSLDIKGKLPTSGNATVDSDCNATINVTDGTCIAAKISSSNNVTVAKSKVYAKGDVVYFNPESGLKCDLAAYTANTGASNNGTKTGCMKWYVYSGLNNTDLSVNMILDHNTTALVAWNSSGLNAGGMKEVATALATDTSTWNSALNARLITATEIATIVEVASWTTSSNYFYFASKTTTQLATCTSPTLTGCTYKWLYDRASLTSATTYGALNNASGTTYGYWTSSAPAGDSTIAWIVRRSGNLGSDAVSCTDNGVRPVITISKSLIS